ncbi:hypothetical protein HanXRQr2_Chr17g0779961 [Helianthus annuus]|uniref:Uncharacterized protein n=1 Tax=Helianthus annuus TaxID=4232 RepID=A0A9K3DD87_HELAN|nr:hypothetical protein HanXRQr2_Chr17g0779961 [Helianthus annuus]
MGLFVNPKKSEKPQAGYSGKARGNKLCHLDQTHTGTLFPYWERWILPYPLRV